jgi:hypothetical protein
MDGFEDRSGLANIAAGSHCQPAHKSRHLIGKNVPEQVRRDALLLGAIETGSALVADPRIKAVGARDPTAAEWHSSESRPQGRNPSRSTPR